LFEGDWEALYGAAVAESDPKRLNARIEAAKQAIHQRLKEEIDDSDSREYEQLGRVLHVLLPLPAGETQCLSR
jgi:hypothetical protein